MCVCVCVCVGGEADEVMEEDMNLEGGGDESAHESVADDHHVITSTSKPKIRVHTDVHG